MISKKGLIYIPDGEYIVPPSTKKGAPFFINFKMDNLNEKEFEELVEQFNKAFAREIAKSEII